MTELDSQRQYLAAMEIPVWVRREKHTQLSPPAPGNVAQPVRQSIPVQQLDWDALEATVAKCRLCELCESRNRTVFGVGDHHADCLIVGEAPGADEDRLGDPFVGRAGQLLNSMLKAIGLSREQVYIANILKCRPPKNRDPRPEEMSSCEPYLLRQIELLQPKVILAAGRIAAQTLLRSTTPIGRLRGRRYVYPPADLPMVVTYHPAYLLRSPLQKSKSWEDLKMLRTILDE